MTAQGYPTYKDSRLDWLGEIPSHWTLERLGKCFSERREKVSDKDFAPLSVTKSGVVPQLDTAAKTDDGENRKKVIFGDFVINGRSDRKGSSGIAKMDGSVSLINIVLTPTQYLREQYRTYLLRSHLFQEEFYRYGKGIVADLWSTKFSDMRNIVLPIPSESEQDAIGLFLEAELQHIDALITEQERLIGLLREKRRAVVNNAVTKGLDASVPMKDSGIGWLGSIPESWSVSRIKYLVRSFTQGWSPQCENFPVSSDHEWGVLKVGCVNEGRFNPQENKTLPADLTPIPSLAITENDVLISRANTRELVGRAALVERDYPNLLLCDKLYRLRVNKSLCHPRLLTIYLGSDVARDRIELEATGASHSMVNIGQSAIRELVMPLPTRSEQTRILAYVDAEITRTELLTEEARNSICLLLERRSALISAAVTGKIDVRGLAPASQEAA